MRNRPFSAKHRSPLATALIVAWLVALSACSPPITGTPTPTPGGLPSSTCMGPELLTPAINSLVVRDGVVYAGAVDVPANQSYIYALDARSGTLLWRHTVGTREPTIAAVVGGMVYASDSYPGGTSGYSVFALRARDGQLVWSVQASEYWPADVAVSGGVVYATGVHSSGSAFLALSATNGTLLWQRMATAGDNGRFSLPTVVGGVVYVYNGPPRVGGGIRYASIYALRASDGAVLWRQPWQRRLATIFAAPLVVNGVIYASVDAGTEIPGAAYALRASDGAVLWQAKLDYSAPYAPVLVNGLFYVTTYSGAVSALNALDTRNGKVRWRFEAPGAPLVQAAADQLLYVTDASGTAALDAASGAVRWRRSLDLVGAVLGSADGVLYLDDGSTALAAVGAGTGNRIWRAKLTVASPVLQVDSADVYLGTGVYLTGCTRPSRPSGVGYVYGLDAATGAVLWRDQTGGQLGS